MQNLTGEGFDALELGYCRDGEVAGGDYEFVEHVGLGEVCFEVFHREGEFLGFLVVAGVACHGVEMDVFADVGLFHTAFDVVKEDLSGRER